MTGPAPLTRIASSTSVWRAATSTPRSTAAYATSYRNAIARREGISARSAPRTAVADPSEVPGQPGIRGRRRARPSSGRRACRPDAERRGCSCLRARDRKSGRRKSPEEAPCNPDPRPCSSLSCRGIQPLGRARGYLDPTPVGAAERRNERHHSGIGAAARCSPALRRQVSDPSSRGMPCSRAAPRQSRTRVPSTRPCRRAPRGARFRAAGSSSAVPW